uniref:General transcription factor IIH subunit 3 n=1 Tax=Triatoma dimidiata TaxID=72491 RepID=A0A0V0GBV7_TRIDM
MLSEEDESSLIVIVLDVNPSQRAIYADTKGYRHILECIIAFCNAHLVLKPDNHLALIACHSGSSEFIFSDKDSEILPTGQNDGQYELLAHVERSVRANLKNFVLRTEPTTGDSLLAGSCAMALCYIHRIIGEKSPTVKMNSRILVITGSGESVSQYMNYMNVFFTAHKENVIVDVLSMEHDLGLLQQGCDITGGLYLKIPQLQGLLQYLLWVFLPEPPLRKKLVLPPPVKVDYRAACFCHRSLIDVGYVCSVCLSVFCKFSPICTTCHALFKTPGPLPNKAKKKKHKGT